MSKQMVCTCPRDADGRVDFTEVDPDPECPIHACPTCGAYWLGKAVVHGHHALCGGRLYLREDGITYCFKCDAVVEEL